MTTPPQQSEQPTNAEEAFAEFLALQEASGAAPPRFDDWIKRYPEHERALRQLESDWRGFDALLRGALGSDSTQSVFHRTPYAGLAPKSFVEFTSERVIGDFRLIRRIGQGGMGEVWEAEQLSLRREVALKFIRPDRLNARAEAYFDREARASGRLNHPGIVAVHATGREGELHWIAQELVPGSSSLNDFLKAVHASRELPRDYFDRVARFVAELCDALQAAHEADVIHRDVKPHNILITDDDHPKLTDFGLARLTDEAALSGSYVVKGTPIYMSPEQVAGKSKLIDHRTDVYSTGAVLFEMLTLRRVFEGESSQIMARILSADAPDPCQVRPEVPAELGAIAQKALERRPADRYLTAAAMSDDLRRYLDHMPVRARPAGPLRRAEKWVWRHPTATSVAAASLVLAGATWFLRGEAQRAVESGDQARREVLLTRAWRKIDAGDLEGAYTEIEGFDDLYPGDPEGHLVLAAGCARSFLQTDMEQELARAAEIGGWEKLDLRGDSAMGLFLEALRWLSTEKSAANERVRDNLERALELDPKLEVAYYPLYYVRKQLGDADGARASLAAYRGTLRTGHPAVRLTDALLTELDGDTEGALRQLQGLEQEVGQAEFSSLRGFRALGRVLLQSYEMDPLAHSERLNEAESALRRAAQDVPKDPGAWSNLALACFRKSQRTPNIEQRRELLGEAEAHALRSLALDERDRGSAITALEALAAGGWIRLDMEADREARSLQVPALEDALDRLEQLAPDNVVLASVRSELMAEAGWWTLADGQEDRAYDLFEASAEAYSQQLKARLMLGQIEWMRKRYRPALTRLEEAEEILSRSRPWEHRPRWRFLLYVWGLGAADKLGELDRAFEYAEKAREVLDTGERVELPEAYSLAEFLATTEHDELRDCELVRRIIADYPIEQTYRPTQPEVWEKIDAACPRD